MVHLPGLAVMILALPGLIQPWSTPPQPAQTAVVMPFTERFEKVFPFFPGGKVEFTAGVPGTVRIEGWNRAEVRIEAEKVFFLPDREEARKLAEKYTVRVRYTQTKATLGTSGPAPAGAMVEIHCKLFVPKAKTDMMISILKGDLVISDINGWIEATLAEGSLDSRRMQGYFSFLTKLGDIEVEMSGKRWDGHGFTAATEVGAATIRLPIQYSAALQLATSDGELEIQYPEQEVEGEKVPLLAVTKKTGRSVSASVGDGGAPVRIHTGKGNVLLTTTGAH